MEPRKYDVLRDGHNKAHDLAQERRDREQLEVRERTSDKSAPARDERNAKTQAERTFEAEKGTRYLWRQHAYESRQQEAFDNARLRVESERYLKANDRQEYDRLMSDKRRDAESEAHQHRVKQAWKERAEGRSGYPDHAREFREAGREQTDNKWSRELSEKSRQTLDQSHARDQQERERERGR